MSTRLSFLGAAQNITGSRYLVEANGTRVMVDCGLYQERQYQSRNWEEFVFEPSTIDAVLLTHGHLDHCGLLPKLYREGFRGRVYCTAPTAEIAPIVLADAAHIQSEDVKFKAKRHAREGRQGPYPLEPLYTAEDVENVVRRFDAIGYRKTFDVVDGMVASFHDAGHILGSSMIRLSVGEGGKKRCILFSGDVGRAGRPMLRDPSLFETADYVVTESTYGDRLHDKAPRIQDVLAEVVNSTCDRGGNLLIPSFAVERAQEVLYRLNQLFETRRIPELMVFLDSPMAIKVTQVFRRHPEALDEEMRRLLLDGSSPFSFSGLRYTATTDQSKSINRIRGSAVIIAGSGMCTGGRIKHHLFHNIRRPESTVLFVGYQATGTLGRLIVDGAQKVRILGAEMPVRARIAQAHGFSGHADRDELLNWLRALKTPPRHVFVTHGGPNVSTAFAELIQELTGWSTSAPAYRDSIELE